MTPLMSHAFIPSAFDDTQEKSGTRSSPDSADNTAAPNTKVSRPTEQTASENQLASGRQRFVFADPVAFRYLEDDRSTTVVERRAELQGYECYVVEQWACSRTHPTFVIATYTGDPSHSIKVGVLSVPTDENAWSSRLKVYFKALNQYHARRRETSLGTLMVTNLSGFPSSLTVIPVPDGDVRKHRECFFVNENLKRLGCSGRVGLKLTAPSGATQAKFHQLYRTSDKISLDESVIELVKLCQLGLMLFGKLASEYADGLLCDMTEKAINDWWIDLGTEHYNIEPHDGILGPTTVAGLLGLLIGARNRLSAFGAPIGKDVFDVESTKRGIAYFQKSQRLQKTRRLDRQTLDRLHRVTAKAASGEGWAVPRAVKSTVAELSGKGGEMVMDMVGARDKSGIADIETTDIERFTQLVRGERPKWLWYGKPRKTQSGDIPGRIPLEDGLIFQKDEQGGYAWSGRRKEPNDEQVLRQGERDISPKQGAPQSAADGKEQHPKKTVLKRATDRMTDARSGLERIKDAVGRRNHHHKPSIDENDSSAHSVNYDSETSLHRMHSAPPYSPPRSSIPKRAPEGARHSVGDQEFLAKAPPVPAFTKVFTHTPNQSETTVVPKQVPVSHGEKGAELQRVADLDREVLKPYSADSSISGSAPKIEGIDDLPRVDERTAQEVGPLFRRTESYSAAEDLKRRYINDSRWARQLSFSVAEESVLRWEGINNMPLPSDENGQPSDTSDQLEWELLSAEDLKRSRSRIAFINNSLGDWVDEKITEVKELDVQAETLQKELNSHYGSKLEDFQALHAEAGECLALERTESQEAAANIEALGAKLEYEVNNLNTKVKDVNDSINEFERQVVFIEEKVQELEDAANHQEGWVHWGIRMLTGLVTTTPTAPSQ